MLRPSPVNIWIESLDRYERLPGDYSAIQLRRSGWWMQGLVMVLRMAGVRSHVEWGAPAGPALRMPEGQWRKTRLRGGDWITFRRRVNGTWSVITYAQGDFERRYRKLANWREEGGGSAAA